MIVCSVDVQFEWMCSCRRPYHVESTGSRPITAVKQRWARSVLAWVTGWEYRVSPAFNNQTTHNPHPQPPPPQHTDTFYFYLNNNNQLYYYLSYHYNFHQSHRPKLHTLPLYTLFPFTSIHYYAHTLSHKHLINSTIITIQHTVSLFHLTSTQLTSPHLTSHHLTSTPYNQTT